MFILAQFIGILVSVTSIIKYFMKEEKNLLIVILGICFFIGTTFLLLGAYTGAICYMIIGTMIMCNYIFKIKNENIPRKVFILYGIGFLIAIIISYKKIYDIILIGIILCYIVLLFKKDDRKVYRISEIISNVILTIYAFLCGGYTIVISSIFNIVIYLRDIYRYDIKKEIEQTQNIEADLKKENEKINENNQCEEKENTTDTMLLTSKVLTGRNISSRNKGKKIYGKTTNLRNTRGPAKYSNNIENKKGR